jgi:UDP-N-acetylmuramate--alanine ligase
MKDLKHIYFIGIGGIGMSAIARYYNARGVRISGYDKTRTQLTQQLETEGIHISYIDSIEAIPKDIDLIIYTPAIPKDHIGFNYLSQSGIKMIKRSEALGLISKNMKSIAIAGTHGKTTTSALTAHVLHVSGLNPSAFLGGIVADYDSNFLIGKSDLVVLEADEFDRSFLRLDPDMACILSMDADHLDIYGNNVQMIEGFVDFAHKVKEKGLLMISSNWINKLSEEDLKQLSKKKVSLLSFGQDQGDIQYSNIKVVDGQFMFDYHGLGHSILGIHSNMPGRHNIENATVAITLALYLGASVEKITKAVSNFKGIRRRFERIVTREKVQYIDDYAHHPSELKATISAARELFPGKKILGIFQPHLYSRTRDFVDGFAAELDKLDEIILMDIYPARELPIEGVTSEIIFDKMANPARHLVTKANVMEKIASGTADIYLTLGAGDIDTFVPLIKNLLHER